MSEITFQDIKKAYFTKASTSQVELCYSGRVVNVKQIKMKDKKEFLKYLEKEDDKLIDSFIDSLIERCVSDSADQQIVATKLVDKERHQLIMKIRMMSTMGDTADIDHTCPKCKKTVSVKFPTENIITTSFKKPEEFDDIIISKNESVKFKIEPLCRADIIEIEKYIDDKKFDTDIEKEFVYLASTVKEIYLVMDDISSKYTPSISERVDFTENLSFDDFDKIKNFFASIGNYGISLNFDFTCPNCGFKSDKEEAKIVDFFIK